MRRDAACLLERDDVRDILVAIVRIEEVPAALPLHGNRTRRDRLGRIPSKGEVDGVARKSVQALYARNRPRSISRTGDMPPPSRPFGLIAMRLPRRRIHLSFNHHFANIVPFGLCCVNAAKACLSQSLLVPLHIQTDLTEKHVRLF